ncbi:MAG: hypothetical protein R3C99_10385 [Pirellulaceae bacterium]
MPLKIACTCGRVLVVAENRAGTRVKCPKCGEKLIVPGLPAASIEAITEPPELLTPPPIQNQTEAAGRKPSGASNPNPIEAAGRKPSGQDIMEAEGRKPSGEAKQDPIEAEGREPSGKTKPERSSGVTEPEGLRPTATKEPEGLRPAANVEPVGQSRTIPRQAADDPAEIPPVQSEPSPSDRAVSPPARSSAPPKPTEPTAKPPRTAVAQPHVPAKPAAASEPSDYEFERPARTGGIFAGLFSTELRGVEHERSRVHTAYWLAGWLVALALFSAAPAVREVFEHLRDIDSPGVARWAHVIVVFCTLQLVYAVFLAQLPDWSSVWVVAVVSLLLAGGYAMVLAITVLSDPGNDVVAILQLAEHAQRMPREPFSRASMWSFIMLSLTGLFTYFAGRVGVRWHSGR